MKKLQSLYHLSLYCSGVFSNILPINIWGWFKGVKIKKEGQQG